MRSAILTVGVLAFASSAQATIISNTSQDGNNATLQCLFNGAAYAPECAGAGTGWITSGPALDPNAEYQSPALWEIGATGQSAASFIIAIAGNAGSNSFGIYDPANPSTALVVYAGGSTTNDKRLITFNPISNQFRVIDTDTVTLLDQAIFSGSTFGFFLEGPGGTFYSDANQNTDGSTQMVAFEGGGRNANFFGLGSAPWLSNEWILAWEDMPYLNSDQDFNDLVLIIESVTPVPVPAPLALLGLGLLGLAFSRKFRA